MGVRPAGAEPKKQVDIPPSTLPPAGSNPIEHVVVFMLENRSYDTYFGWLEGSRGFLELGLELEYTDPDDTAVTLSPTHWAPDYRRRAEHPDPGHGWTAGRGQLEHGFLFGSNDEYALAYYLPEDIPYHARIARQFTVFDDYYCALLGPTYPNRLYQHSGTSGGYKSNVLPPQSSNPDHQMGFPWPTIWDRLDAKNVPNAYYCVDLPAIGLFGPRLFHKIRHIEQFFADAAAGTLPNVTFVDPGFLTPFRTDDHPSGSDMRASQAFVNNIVHAVVASPLWRKTAMFINYDEWGGFFDHVRPPRAEDDMASDDINEDFGQRGFRVPCLAISPYSRKGYVHQDGPYDHTSILKFIEYRYGLEPLTTRVSTAKNIGEAFDYTQTPRLEIGIDQVETPTVFFSSGELDGSPELFSASTTDFDKLADWLTTLGWLIPETSWNTVFGFGSEPIPVAPPTLR